MSSCQEFPQFTLLPKEIRILIWERSLAPRVLALHCTNITGSKALADNLVMTLGNHARANALSASEKHDRVSRMVRLTLTSLDPIPLLSVCHESREIVQHPGSGYRAWNIHCKDGSTRDVLWNPLSDTVAFVAPHIHAIPSFYIKILEMQFPSQAKEIQRLAMPTSNWFYWRRGAGERADVATRWLGLESLREMVVVIDEAWEKRFVERISHNRPGGIVVQRNRFEIPEDIETSLQTCKENAPAGWQVPSFRVVRQESDILSEQSIEVCLRCFPCPDLGEF